MNLLIQTIEDDYKRAYRGGDKTTTEVLRVLKTTLYNAEIEKRSKTSDREAKLTDEEAVGVVRRYAKQLEEAGELFAKGGRQDLVAQNDAELAVVSRYLPAAVSEAQVREAVKVVLGRMGQVEPQDFGKVMGAAMKELKGAADGALTSKIVKELLTA